MTLEQAKKLKAGDYFHHKTKRYSTGHGLLTARVTSVKTWKRTPGRIEVRYKYGMHEYGIITENELDEYEIGDGR